MTTSFRLPGICFGLLLCLTLYFVPEVSAQSKYEDARAYLDSRDYQRALGLYKELYTAQPGNPEIFSEYLLVLTELKDYKTAEQIASDALKRNQNDPLNMVLLGNIYLAQKKDKKALDLFERALSYINGDDVLTQQIASAFRNAGNTAWTIRTYERAIELTQSPGLYSAPLAKLYSQQGETAKAVEMVLRGAVNMPHMGGDESTESALLEIVGSDPDKQKIAQKSIIRMINAQPDNYQYTNLLIWIFSLQNSWDQALVQVTALEKRNSEKGRLLLEFAANAAAHQQYGVAARAYEALIAYGPNNPLYIYAQEQMLQMSLSQIENDPDPKQEAIKALSATFKTYFEAHPEAYAKPLVKDYARLEAQFNGSPASGAELLKKAIAMPAAGKAFIAECKLQLGDYYIITGQLWEAALLYAQVDKAFKQDALGEEARFRNAKLSYYQNDFEQAQGQLSVLKASTSELIANDAMALSLLITENVPADSNMLPLQRFAYADLLVFQNRDDEANRLLDSITTAFPKTSLADDILMLRAQLSLRHHRFAEAQDFLKQIIERYGKDVLADDAMFRIAEIDRKYLNKTDDARRYYEQLIIDYPGSSYVQQARKTLQDMGAQP
ncbi:tetratricopeptide repeat protein [Rurimicrobium arvi]|uniref:Tetratricopeptide repeat protein n=1 Tax=Rurimicrobium arvi TaxID=2049916 RepID=A0ABP8MIR1_9BACT